MKSIVIYHHLGIGDTIECNGMVRYFAEKYSEVHIFAKHIYYDLVKFMYRDNLSIIVNKIDTNSEYKEVNNFISKFNGEVLVCGHANYFSNLHYFKKKYMGPGESFYYLAGVPWKYRNEKFFVTRDLEKEEEVYKKLNPNNEKYVFVHDDPIRGYCIDLKTDYKIIKNDIDINIFHMIYLLEKAEEIHCMSSSILCLIDCLGMQTKFNKLFLYHDIRKVDLGPNGLFMKWNIV